MNYTAAQALTKQLSCMTSLQLQLCNEAVCEVIVQLGLAYKKNKCSFCAVRVVQLNVSVVMYKTLAVPNK